MVFFLFFGYNKKDDIFTMKNETRTRQDEWNNLW